MSVNLFKLIHKSPFVAVVRRIVVHVHCSIVAIGVTADVDICVERVMARLGRGGFLAVHLLLHRCRDAATGELVRNLAAAVATGVCGLLTGRKRHCGNNSCGNGRQAIDWLGWLAGLAGWLRLL